MMTMIILGSGIGSMIMICDMYDLSNITDLFIKISVGFASECTGSHKVRINIIHYSLILGMIVRFVVGIFILGYIF